MMPSDTGKRVEADSVLISHIRPLLHQWSLSRLPINSAQAVTKNVSESMGENRPQLLKAATENYCDQGSGGDVLRKISKRSTQETNE